MIFMNISADAQKDVRYLVFGFSQHFSAVLCCLLVFLPVKMIYSKKSVIGKLSMWSYLIMVIGHHRTSGFLAEIDHFKH